MSLRNNLSKRYTACVTREFPLLSAINSLGSVEEKMLESHLGTCVVTQMQGKNKNQAIAEVLSVYKLAKRK
jgi:hypothetical protein